MEQPTGQLTVPLKDVAADGSVVDGTTDGAEYGSVKGAADGTVDGAVEGSTQHEQTGGLFCGLSLSNFDLCMHHHRQRDSSFLVRQGILRRKNALPFVGVFPGVQTIGYVASHKSVSLSDWVSVS
jgi:hypothetical protein